jgi:hypothetical protein
MDITATLAPKSSQLNADDLIAGPRTITITKVTAGNNEQPVAIHFDGDSGRPWYPCKGMRRVIVAAWGPDSSQYIGRSVTLFRNPEVTYGGIQVGGIQISHLSNLDSPLSIALTMNRQKRTPYKVQPLKTAPAPAAPAPAPPAAAADPAAAAYAACKKAGLTDAGIEALCLKASDGAYTSLADLSPKMLAWLASARLTPDRVAEFNGTTAEAEPEPEDAPLPAWAN